MSLEQELVKIVKKLKGNLITIDVSNDKTLEAIKKNKKLINVYEFTFGGRIYPKVKSIKGKNKYHIKKMKKYFEKKSVNYFMCEINHLKKFFHVFIKDSIDLNNNTIYLYGEKNSYSIKELKYRYERYGCKVEIVENELGFILIIKTGENKTSKLQNFKYYVRDSFYNLGELITQILIN
ncbi:MAG: hypothetical protein PHO63_03325 [Bacilli bacterium]|nr:hypothetical protein [Bacilli bacterium]MDD4809132.1 hypothetical protein [Bacilli bacterium]